MNARLRIAVLGTARIARSVIPHIQASAGAEVVAIASRSLAKAQQFAAELNVLRAFGSYQEALQSSEVDAVYIPLPPSMHCEWTVRAAEAGKHVLCEKPLGVAANDATTMIEACRKHSVVLLDGTMWYHTARAREMKRLASDGTLGDLRQVTSAFTFPANVLAAENVRFSQSLGGGSLLDVGWYCVGVSLWLLDRMPVRVFAAAEWKGGVDMRMNGLMWFAEGEVASFESGFNAIRRRWLELAGSKAALVCDDFSRPWNPEKPRFWIHDADGVSHQQIVAHPPIERCLIDAFCELIAQKKVDHEWLTLSLRTQQVCDALMRSAKSGAVEPL